MTRVCMDVFVEARKTNRDPGKLQRAFESYRSIIDQNALRQLSRSNMSDKELDEVASELQSSSLTIPIGDMK